VAITQPLLRGLAAWQGDPLRAVTADVDRAHRARAAQRQDLVARAIELYLQAERQGRLAQVAIQARDRTQQFARMLRARTAAGLATELDVMRAELAHAEATLAVGQQQEALDLLQDRLRALMGRRDDRPLTLAPSRRDDDPDVVFETPAALALARAHRPELADARARVAFARQTAREARWQALPPLDLDVSYTRRGLAGNAAPGWTELFGGWRVGVSSSYGVDRDDDAIARERTRIGIRHAERDLAGAEERIEGEVRAAVRAVARAATSIELARAQAAIADRAARLAELRYERGLATSVELLDADAQRAHAAAALATAEIDRQLARLQLERAAGIVTPETWR
jgi:outer membrane protein TolC